MVTIMFRMGTAEFDGGANDQEPAVTHSTRDRRAHAVC